MIESPPTSNSHSYIKVDSTFRRDALLFILVSIFLVASDTWLFKGDIFPGRKNLEVAIRLIIPAMLVIFFRKYTIPPKAKVLLILYGILSFYMLFMSFFSENPILVALNTFKMLYILAFLVTLLLILRPSNFSYHFLYIPIYLGLFFSIQTIILFVLIQTGHPPPSGIVSLVGYEDMPVLSYGLWGYAHGMSAIGGDLQVYRAQSFFGEPTVFANFMETATILSFGLYRVKQDKKMLVVSGLCATSLFLAFSITAYLVVFLTFCFYMIVLNWKKMGILVPIVVAIAVPAIIVVILFYFSVITHPDFYGQSTWGFAFGHGDDQIWVRVEAFKNSLLIFMDHPLGIGLIGHGDSGILANYPMTGSRLAPTGWMMSAGIVGIAAQLTILFYLFRNIIIKYLRMNGKIERYIALSFVITLVHHVLAGNWFTAMFFYLLVCLIVTDAYRFSFYRKFKGLHG